jgi:HD superfamily phosphohydrolase
MQFSRALEKVQREWYHVLDPSTAQWTESGYIRDPIHGHIKLEPFDFFVLNLPPMQRLRAIAQLSFVDRIYPGANHTRFEHSLGVGTLAHRLLVSLQQRNRIRKVTQIGRNEIYSTKLAGYVHDIGHLPFSHALERLFDDLVADDYSKVGMKRGDHKPHELLGYLIIKSKYFLDVIERLNKQCRLDIDPEFVASLATGSQNVPFESTFLSEMIHGDFDCDRMDYLMRDAYYCGVPHGAVDLERLIETLTIVPRRTGLHLGVEEAGVTAVEAMYFSRTTMYASVYLHHTSRIIEGMILRAANDSCKRGRIKLPALLGHNDSSLLSLMQSQGTDMTKSCVSNLAYRKFPKRLFVKRLMDIYPLSYSTPGIPLQPGVVEKIGPLIDKVNVELGDIKHLTRFESDCTRTIYGQSTVSMPVILDCPTLKLPSEPSREKHFPVRLRTNNEVRSLLNLSPVVRAIAQDKTAYQTSIILAGDQPEKYREKAKKYITERFKREFGIDMEA